MKAHPHRSPVPPNWRNQNLTSKLRQNRNRYPGALYRRSVATHSRPVWHHQRLPPYRDTPSPKCGKINMLSIGGIVEFPCLLVVTVMMDWSQRNFTCTVKFADPENTFSGVRIGNISCVDYIFAADNKGLSSFKYLWLDPKNVYSVLKCIMAVESHPRSSSLVLIESVSATSYWWSVATLVLLCIISEIPWLKGQKSPVRIYPSLI